MAGAAKAGLFNNRLSTGIVLRSSLAPAWRLRDLDKRSTKSLSFSHPRYSLLATTKSPTLSLVASHLAKRFFTTRHSARLFLLFLPLALSFTYFTYIPHSLPTTPHTLRRQPSPPACLYHSISSQHCKPPLDIFRNVVQHHVQHFGYNREP